MFIDAAGITNGASFTVASQFSLVKSSLVKLLHFTVCNGICHV